MTIPIATSPGRSGFGPQLSLSYDSGSGNGPFGFGWSLSLPAITRKTDKGLPHYQDAEESDVFILSGAEDLVPVLIEVDGKWEREQLPQRTINGDSYQICRYRPRIEGLFARIERWQSNDNGKIHWRATTKDNVSSIYGDTEDSRISDPDDGRRVFSWLLARTYDDKGNLVVYQYKGENLDNVPTEFYEKNRKVTANRYLKRISYTHQTPFYPADDPNPPQDWHMQVVFDYGEHNWEQPQIDDDTKNYWSVRADPFSSYRAGFEIRTYRRCQRVLMFHWFPELGTDPCLVRSTDFTYIEEGEEPQKSLVASFIASVTQSGYIQKNDGYFKRPMPPVEFIYSQVQINDQVETVDPLSLENLPNGLDGARYQWVDLDGEGLSGILVEQGSAWYYKRNLSPMTSDEERNGKPIVLVTFGALEIVRSHASLANLSGGEQQLLDLAGDGQVDLVQLAGPMPGFYERTHDERWESFRNFEACPNLDWSDQNLRFVDLTGDGHADILITEDSIFTWYPSLAEDGFGQAKFTHQFGDEEACPRLVFADGTQSVYLSDMSGDGLSDLVRIRNGEICYWPNLGYGRFGARITMKDAPWYDPPDLFDQRRIRLADIDGSGSTDIIYLGQDMVRIYFNRSGNSWSDARELAQFPKVDNLAAVMTVDLLGNGTACLVWSSPLPGDDTQPMRYIDLMGGQKPHLLVCVKNNLGAETCITYAPSTRFYLDDKLAGKPWITRLPFPVHVVERVETFDWISRNRFVTRYAYHHGYFDGEEREFRGFGRVDQWDTEEIGTASLEMTNRQDTNWSEDSFVPPVLTKTWFHTGIYIDREHISNYFAGVGLGQGEYFREPSLVEDEKDQEAAARLLEDTVLPEHLTLDEEREACRALKGAMLRQEIYALDGSEKEKYPYTVTEQNFTIQCLQPRQGNRHAVFFTHAREAINYHYERTPSDPRISHAMTMEVDEYGNVLKSVAIGYGRKVSPLSELKDRLKQTSSLITYTENNFTNPILAENDYRAPMPADTRTYELTGYIPTGDAGRFQMTDFVQRTPDGMESIFDSEINYEDEPSEGSQRRLIEYVRTLYRKDDLSEPCSFKEMEALALPYETYKLAFTPGLLAKVYQRTKDGQAESLIPEPDETIPAEQATNSNVTDRGGYVQLDGSGGWWIPSGQVRYTDKQDHLPAQELTEARQHFYLPGLYIDPFGNTSQVEYDAYDLLVTCAIDPLLSLVIAENDYRVLQPMLITDPNGNRSEAIFDTLGMVAGTAVMGKVNEPDGKPKGDLDLLDGFEPDLSPDQINEFFNAKDPHVPAFALLDDATTRNLYDLDRFCISREANPDDPSQWQPVFAATLARETHFHDPLPTEGLNIQISFSYSDGFGREIQKKIQAEPGPVEGLGEYVEPRWVGSGWTVFNNKGKPVRQYEPFFSRLEEKRHHFEFGAQYGVSPILFYDPAERVIATLHPNHTYEKVLFDPWQQTSYDVNDTVLSDPRTDPDIAGVVEAYFETQPEGWQTWYTQRQDGQLGAQEQAAAHKAAMHANTPTTVHFDALGRPYLTVALNKFERKKADGTIEVIEESPFCTRVNQDIEGNQREVRDTIVQGGDALGRIVMVYDYDMLGNRIHQASMEAGERWMLNNVSGNPIRAWDSRGYTRRMTYDTLQRLRELLVRNHGDDEFLAESMVYGEDKDEPERSNHRGKVWQVKDGTGILTSEGYDFKGNLLRSTRQLLKEYKNQVDWTLNPELEDDELFTSQTKYDALNRPITVTTPDGSIYQPSFNKANLLEGVEVKLNGAREATVFVRDINYNARGQREMIEYGIEYDNGVRTNYQYDPLTFRLVHLQTLRNTEPLQDLSYTYDPAGNITHIRDDAQQTMFFRNHVVEPYNEYTYDAVYRLIEAVGREHLGQNGGQRKATPPDQYNQFHTNLDHPGSGEAMGTYTERYAYDAAGNILEVKHHTSDPHNPDWIRVYDYKEFSLLEDSKTNNRLTQTQVGNDKETYTYLDADSRDVHGCMTSINSMVMKWDFEDQLQQVDLGGGGTAYYVYDSGGQRVRKVHEHNGSTVEERIYLGGFEIYRKRGISGVELERETLHIMDGEQRIALVEIRTQGDDGSPQQLIRYPLCNHLGSASLELDQNAEMISYEEYYPYGSTSYQAVDKALKAAAKRYRYTGKERDDESGLYYYKYRLNISWLGRWACCDPYEILDGLNLYIYARNNPVTKSDENGSCTNEKTITNTEQTRVFDEPTLDEEWPQSIDTTLGNFNDTFVNATNTDKDYVNSDFNKFVGVFTVEFPVHSRGLQEALKLKSNLPNNLNKFMRYLHPDWYVQLPNGQFQDANALFNRHEAWEDLLADVNQLNDYNKNLSKREQGLLGEIDLCNLWESRGRKARALGNAIKLLRHAGIISNSIDIINRVNAVKGTPPKERANQGVKQVIGYSLETVGGAIGNIVLSSIIHLSAAHPWGKLAVGVIGSITGGGIGSTLTEPVYKVFESTSRALNEHVNKALESTSRALNKHVNNFFDRLPGAASRIPPLPHNMGNNWFPFSY